MIYIIAAQHRNYLDLRNAMIQRSDGNLTVSDFRRMTSDQVMRGRHITAEDSLIIDSSAHTLPEAAHRDFEEAVTIMLQGQLWNWPAEGSYPVRIDERLNWWAAWYLANVIRPAEQADALIDNEQEGPPANLARYYVICDSPDEYRATISAHRATFESERPPLIDYMWLSDPAVDSMQLTPDFQVLVARGTARQSEVWFRRHTRELRRLQRMRRVAASQMVPMNLFRDAAVDSVLLNGGVVWPELARYDFGPYLDQDRGMNVQEAAAHIARGGREAGRRASEAAATFSEALLRAPAPAVRVAADNPIVGHAMSDARAGDMVDIRLNNEGVALVTTRTWQPDRVRIPRCQGIWRQSDGSIIRCRRPSTHQEGTLHLSDPLEARTDGNINSVTQWYDSQAGAGYDYNLPADAQVIISANVPATDQSDMRALSTRVDSLRRQLAAMRDDSDNDENLRQQAAHALLTDAGMEIIAFASPMSNVWRFVNLHTGGVYNWNPDIRNIEIQTGMSATFEANDDRGVDDEEDEDD